MFHPYTIHVYYVKFISMLCLYMLPFFGWLHIDCSIHDIQRLSRASFFIPRYFFHHDDDYVSLAHSNMNVDNAAWQKQKKPWLVGYAERMPFFDKPTLGAKKPIPISGAPRDEEFGADSIVQNLPDTPRSSNFQISEEIQCLDFCNPQSMETSPELSKFPGFFETRLAHCIPLFTITRIRQWDKPKIGDLYHRCPTNHWLVCEKRAVNHG